MRLCRYFGIFVASLGLMSCSLMYDHCGDDSDCNAAIGERCLGRDGNTKQKVCVLPERECDPDSWRFCPASCQQDDSGRLIEHCLGTGRWGGCFGDEAKLSCPVGFLLYNFSRARVSEEVDEVVEGKRSDYTCVAMQKEEIQAAMQEREEAVLAKTLEPFQEVCLDKDRKSFAVLNVHCCAALNAYEDRSAITSIVPEEVLKQCAETHSRRREVDVKSYKGESTHTACFATLIKADSEEQDVDTYQYISQKKLDVRLSQAQVLNCIDKLQQGIDESFDSTTDPARVIYNDALVYTYQNRGNGCENQNYLPESMVPLAFKDSAIPEPKCSDFIEETTLTLLDFARIADADAQRKRVECDSLSQCEPRDSYLYLSRLALLNNSKTPEGNAMTAASAGGIVKCDPLAPNILKDLDLCSSFYKSMNDDANLPDWPKIIENSCFLSLSKLVDGFYQHCPVSTKYSDDYDKAACASYLKGTIKNQMLACSVYGVSCVNRPNAHCLRPVLATQDSTSTVDKDFGTMCYFDKYGLSDDASEAGLQDDLWAYLSSCEGGGMSTVKSAYKWTDVIKMSMLQKCFQANSECDILESPSDAAVFDNSLGSDKKPRSLYTRCNGVKDSYLLCEKRDEKIDLVCSYLSPSVSSDPLDCDGEHISILTEEGLSLTDTDFLELTNMDPNKLRFFDAKPYQTSSAKGFVIALAYETSKETYKKSNATVSFLSAPEEKVQVSFSNSEKTYQAGEAYILLTKFDEEDALLVVGFSTFSHKLDLPMLYIGETTLAKEQNRFLELSGVGSYMPRQPKLNVFVVDDHLEVDVFYIADRPLEGDVSTKPERQLFIDIKPESQMKATYTPFGATLETTFQAYLTLDSPTLYVRRFEINDDQIVSKSSTPTVLETKFEGGKCNVGEMACTGAQGITHKLVLACAKSARLVCTDRYLDDVLDFDLRGTGLEARVNAVRGLEDFEHVETITYGVDEDKYALQTESRSYDINGNYQNIGNCLTAAESAIPLQLGTTWRFLNRDYIVGFMSQANSKNPISKTMITLQEGGKLPSAEACKGGDEILGTPMAAWRYNVTKPYYPPQWNSAKSIFATDHRFVRTASSGELCSRWVSAWMGQEESGDGAQATVNFSSMLACLADPKNVEALVSLQGVISNSIDLGIGVKSIEDMTVTVLTPSRLSPAPRILVRSQSQNESGPRMTHFSLFELNTKDETLQWILKTPPASLGGEMNGFSKWFKRDGLVLDGSKLNYIRLGCRNTAP